MATITSSINSSTATTNNGDSNNTAQTTTEQAKVAAQQNQAQTPQVTAEATKGVSSPTKESTVPNVTASSSLDADSLKSMGLTDAEINNILVGRGVSNESLNAMKQNYTNIADSLKQNGINIADSMKLQNYDQTEDVANLDAKYKAAQEQATNQIDYATETGVKEYQRAQAETDENYDELRRTSATEAAKAQDNAALYSASRGDNGGIGQAQYNQVLADAANAQREINKEQTKAASTTANAIADLRAQGEYEKADKLLELTQSYLSELLEIKQWAANYNLSVAQANNALVEWETEFNEAISEYNASLDQWQTNYNQGVDEFNASLAEWGYEQNQAGDQYNAEALTNLLQQKQDTLVNAGETLLAAGIMPSADQLEAMGMTSSQAQQYINMVLYGSSSGSSSSGGSYSSGGSSSTSSSNSETDTDGGTSYTSNNGTYYYSKASTDGSGQTITGGSKVSAEAAKKNQAATQLVYNNYKYLLK